MSAVSTLSKKRYYDIAEGISHIIGDESKAEEAMAMIRAVMNFDPETSRYTPELGEKMKERLHKKSIEQGVSTYVVSGRKKYYETSVRQECQNYLCEAVGKDQYKGYCTRCFIHLFPEESIVKNYKTKEAAVTQFIKECFPDRQLITDKKVEGGCSRFRPDILFDCLTHSVILEVDENQHDTYDCTCENKRLMTLFTDLGERPIVMIRFNPDDYITKDGSTVPSCFKYTKKQQLPSVGYQKEWESRLATLKSVLEWHLENVPTREVTVEHLYYDGFM